MKENTLGKVLNTDLTGTGTWSTHGCLWWRIYMTFSIAKVHWKTNCSAECHLPCINSPHKEQVHKPGTPLAALRGQKQVICANISKSSKTTKLQFIHLHHCLNFHCSLWLKLANVARCNWVPRRGTLGAAHCAQLFLNRFSKFLCLSCGKFPEFFKNVRTFAICMSRSQQQF